MPYHPDAYSPLDELDREVARVEDVVKKLQKQQARYRRFIEMGLVGYMINAVPLAISIPLTIVFLGIGHPAGWVALGVFCLTLIIAMTCLFCLRLFSRKIEQAEVKIEAENATKKGLEQEKTPEGRLKALDKAWKAFLSGPMTDSAQKQVIKAVRNEIVSCKTVAELCAIRSNIKRLVRQADDEENEAALTKMISSLDALYDERLEFVEMLDALKHAVSGAMVAQNTCNSSPPIPVAELLVSFEEQITARQPSTEQILQGNGMLEGNCLHPSIYPMLPV